MRKDWKYKSLFILAIVATLSSCKKDFIELKPTITVDPNVALSTEPDVKNALSGAYAGLRQVDFYGRTVPILGDLMGDNIYQHSSNSNRYTAFNAYSFVVNNANILGTWTQGYNVILRTNNIINVGLPQSATLDQYKGEAYAIRALAYFTLIRYFARPYTDQPDGLGLPLILKYDPFVRPTRSKTSEVYAQIISDLTNAFNLMTAPTDAAATKNSSQFTKYAAKGLLAKVYLTMGNMPAAKTAAEDVILNSGYKPLQASDVTGYWSNSSFRTDKLETLFEVSSDAVSNLSFDALSYIYSQNGNYGDFVASTPFYNMFSANDVRRQLMPFVPRFNRPTGTPIATVDKYPVIQGDLSDTKVLRLSEMYLIAAEAAWYTNETEALTYVNFITSRRNADPIVSAGAQLYEDIITERRKELAFEGDRYMDLLRLKRDVSRSTNYPASARTIVYDNYRRIFPIPQSELDANPNIRTQQNTGYN